MSDTEKAPDNSDKGTQVETIEIPEQFVKPDGSTDVEALAKSYADSRKGMNQAFAERDSLKQQLESQATNEKLVETLESVKKAVEPKEETPPSLEEYADSWAKNKAEEEGLEVDSPTIKLAKEAMIEAMRASNTWYKQDTQALKEEYDAKFDDMKTMLGQTETNRVKTSPEYIAHKAEIDELTEAFGDEQKAIAHVLKKYANTSDVGTPPPGTPDGQTHTAPAKSSYWADDAERQAFVRNHGEEKAVKMEQNYADRLLRTTGKVA